MTAEISCEKCEKVFVAEGELSEGQWAYSPVCYDCDVQLRRDVDEILRQRGHGSPGPRWYDNQKNSGG